jgi:hypothetical protein
MGYMSVMDGIDLGMAGLNAGLNSLATPQPPLGAYYKWQQPNPAGVPVEAYNSLVAEHNALVQELAAERRKAERLQAQLRDALNLLKRAVRS